METNFYREKWFPGIFLNWRRRWKRRFRWHHQPLEKEDSSNDVALGTEAYNPETLYGKKELDRIIKEGLKTLPEDARTVFILKELEGMSYDEIAGILKIKKAYLAGSVSVTNYIDIFSVYIKGVSSFPLRPSSFGSSSISAKL